MGIIAPPHILAAARTTLGLAQSEVAAATGVSRSSLQRIEIGKVRPGRNTITLQEYYEGCGVEFIRPSEGGAWGILDKGEAFRAARLTKVIGDEPKKLRRLTPRNSRLQTQHKS